jgi:hypothetical protein
VVAAASTASTPAVEADKPADNASSTPVSTPYARPTANEFETTRTAEPTSQIKVSEPAAPPPPVAEPKPADPPKAVEPTQPVEAPKPTELPKPTDIYRGGEASSAADTARNDFSSRPSSTPPAASGSAVSGSIVSRPEPPAEPTVRTAAPSGTVPVVPGVVPVPPPPPPPMSTSARIPAAKVASGSHPVVSPPTGPVIARASVAVPAATAAPGTIARGGTAATGAVGAARVSDAVRTARATVAGASRGPRRARLHLKRIDPWSMMKFSFAVSLVLFVVAIVATSVLYLALDAMGVFDSLNKALSDIVGGSAGSSSFKITAKGVIGASVLLGAVNMVLFTALMTLGAFVYNVCADLVGGIELTLSEKD